MPCRGLGTSSRSSCGGGGKSIFGFAGGGRRGEKSGGGGGREGLTIFVAHVEEHPHAELGEFGGKEELQVGEGRKEERGMGKQ